MTIVIPDVTGLSLKKAALTYAEAGMHIVPTRVGDVKNPGSIVHAGWKSKATCDPAQIEKWFAEEKRIGGLAFHPGPSGVVIFDFDRNCTEKPDDMGDEIWDALQTGKFHATRKTGYRGHYLFSCEPGEFGCAAGEFIRWGEVRSQGGVVILAPSVHSSSDGNYHWRSTGELLPVPDVLTDMLSLAGHETEPFTDDELENFLNKHTESTKPDALRGLAQYFKSRVEKDFSRHTTMCETLPWAFEESIIGRFPARQAFDELEEAFHQAKPEALGTGAFYRIAQWAASHAQESDPTEIRKKAERRRKEINDEIADSEPIFRQFGPAEWSQKVAPTRFLIKRALSTDTWGVNAGPKKTLKTHDNQAIALAVATGRNLYNDARFPVERPGKVLYIVGEGGQNQVFRVLHRMCRAYGISLKDVRNDPNFPLALAFGAAPLDSLKLRDELKKMLDEHQPSLVLMESFYNFHPVGVTASNLYERGQLIDDYHKFVRSGGEDVVSLLTDHNKKAATGTDLNQISMAGQAENVDSWIMRDHRIPPDVTNGEFWLETSFNGRDWGGNAFHVDWHLGPYDHDLGAHTGQISWDVSDRNANAVGSPSQVSRLRADLLLLIVNNPWAETRTTLKAKLKYRNEEISKEIAVLLADKVIEDDKPSNRGASGKADVFGPGPAMPAAASKLA